MIARRAVIAGLAGAGLGGAELAGAGLATRALAAGDRDAEAKAALDAAAAETDPVKALALLRALPATGWSRAIALDLAAARAGLALDVALADAPKEARYALLLKRGVGDDADPDRARVRLEAELAALTARATRLFDMLGDTSGSVGDRYRRLWQDARFLYPDDEDGRTRAVADMNRTLEGLMAGLSRAFAHIPAECRNVSVRALNAQEIAAGRNGYRIVPEPGKPGFYIVDLKEIRRRPSWSLPSVVAHETLPGHLLQLPIEAIAKPHPLRLRYAPNAPEGWGIYAEQLADRWGAFRASPYDELGHLHWLLFRVTRALVDLGLHRGGWSITDARAKLLGWIGEPGYFAPFDPDLDRIAREPATGTAEALAWLAIADRARGLSGVALIRFHTALLAPGRVRTEQLTAITGRRAP